jgi:hypothetical protein
LWRLISVAAACGAVAALAYYLNAVHHADDFATVAVITTAYTVTFWAAKRPSQFAGRFGPFGKIAAAVRESQDDLRRWVMDKPLKAGAMIAACYGLAVVLAIVAGLWNPWLAVALGAGIGAVVAAPHMFAALGQRITGQNTPAPAPAVQAPEAQQQPPGPSTLRPVPPAPPAALPGDPAGPQDPPSNHSPT